MFESYNRTVDERAAVISTTSWPAGQRFVPVYGALGDWSPAFTYYTNRPVRVLSAGGLRDLAARDPNALVACVKDDRVSILAAVRVAGVCHA